VELDGGDDLTLSIDRPAATFADGEPPARGRVVLGDQPREHALESSAVPTRASEPTATSVGLPSIASGYGSGPRVRECSR
jgi:hypothetical protein